MRHHRFPFILSAGVALVIATPGCRQFGFTRVGDGVYISGSSPAIERAGEEISTARKQVHGNDPAQSALPDLSVSINSAAGLGLEDFRILAEDKSIRVEGGGPAGAYYGGLEVARRIREGRPIQSIVLPRSSPAFPLRALRAAVELPGLSSKPASGDWRAFLDKVAAGRFNTLIVPSCDCFSALVRLARFPKAFDPPDRDAGQRQKAFGEVLAFADERNIRLILVPTELRVPQSFLRNYGNPGADETTRESLSRSFLRECIVEVLRAYPQLRGIGVGGEALAGRSAAQAEELVRSVFADGIRVSGRAATLFIASEAALTLAKVNPSGVDVLRELGLPSSPGTAPAQSALPKSDRVKLCGRIPVQHLFPSWPTPEQCAAFLEAARSATPDGFTVDLFGSPAIAAQGSFPLEREGLLAACFGLSACQPPFEPASWVAMWRDLSKAQSGPLLRAANAAAEIWPELALFHDGPAWSPLTSSEAGRAPGGKDLRDDQPFVSLVELVFSSSGSPVCLSIPELIALEAKKEAPAASRRAPLDVAERILSSCSTAITAITEHSAEWGDGATAGTTPEGAPVGFAAAAAAEIEAFARLGEFHAHRIRAGVFLLRHAAGLSDGARGEAIAEMGKASASWLLAEAAFTRLRRWFPGAQTFPDLKTWRGGVDEDLKLVRAVKSDPVGFRASPLFAEASAPSRGFDFRSLRGFIDLGTSILCSPPVELLDESQVFEAEDFFGTWTLLKDVAGFSGEGYVSSGAAGERAAIPLTLRLRVREPAAVHVWVRSLAGGGGDPPSVRVRAAGVDLKPTHATTSGTPRFTWERAGKLELEAGEVFLQIVDEGAGKEGVDAIVLARDGNWVPPAF